MTEDEWAGLIDLYLEDALPEALAARVEDHLLTHPEAARDAQTLRGTITRLQAVPPERPDAWFTERTLDRLLQEHAREHSAAQGETREGLRAARKL